MASCQRPLPAVPRLGVLVVFDQLRAAELDRYAPFFDGGFGGLEARGGARFDARYSYADTETAPGHATISTGANPRTHGIVANYWFGADGKNIYCTEDPSAPVLGSKKTRGASARLMHAQTLGDTMKLETNGRARVVTFSLKDRSAVLTGGRAADMAIWYDGDQCAFTTSRAYGSELPGWVRWMATELPQKSMASGRWSPLPIPRALEALENPDGNPNEAAEVAWKDTFPHDLASIESPREKCIAYRASPQAMEDLFHMARVAVESPDLALGDDVVPDLLVVSVSSTDYVGHGYGPQSLETLDLLRRSDLALRELVRFLDARLGKDGYVIAVTSDHASTALPETARALGLDAGRISVTAFRARVEEAIARAVDHLQPKAARPEPLPQKVAPPTLGPHHMIAKDATSQPTLLWMKGFAPPHLFLDLARIEPALRRPVLEAARQAIVSFEGIAEAYLVENGQVLGNDAFVPKFQELVFKDRHGAILVRPKARWIYAFDDETVGTDHGTPYVYDATVPFILSGPGVRGGRYAQPCDVRDIAPSLAFSLHMPAPDHAEGKPVAALGK